MDSNTWRDEVAMRGFRASGAHLKAMPRLLEWYDEASVAHWSDPAATIPSADVAYQRLRTDGRVSRVHLNSGPEPTRIELAGSSSGAARRIVSIVRVANRSCLRHPPG